MTTLMRWNPLLSHRRDLNGLRSDFDHLFDNLLSSTARERGGLFTPAADIHETEEAYVVRLDLPGVAQEDVKVTILGDTLTIRGERKLEEMQAKDSVHYRERSFGTFERTFTLTAPVRANRVRATYRDGVLEVSIPKAEEAKAHEVEIQVG